jgi:hypothetical protein
MSLDVLAHTAFIGAKYHLDKIIELSANPCIQTNWQYENNLDDRKKEKLQADLNQFFWHIRGFFWELVASFDTILQWVNQKYELGEKEDKVRWDNINTGNCKSKELQAEWEKKHEILEDAWQSEWYYEVNKYRNFSHRAFLYVQTEFDYHYGKSGPTLEKIWLLPAREGQPEYADLITQLSNYMVKMNNLGRQLFSD